MLDWLKGIFGASPPREVDLTEIRKLIKEEFVLTQVLTGQVTKVYEDYCIVDNKIYLPDSLLPKIRENSNPPKSGDWVIIRVGRNNEEEDWQVLDLLELSGKSWEEEVDNFTDKDLDDVRSVTDPHSADARQPLQNGIKNNRDRLEVRIVCTVTEANGGRVKFNVNKFHELSVSLTQRWKQSFLPATGDLLIVTLELAGMDLEEFEGCEVTALEPTRVKNGCSCVIQVDRFGVVLAADVFVPSATTGGRRNPRFNDRIHFICVECEASRRNCNSSWRAVSATVENNQLNGRYERTFSENFKSLNSGESWIVRGGSRMRRKARNYLTAKLGSHPVPRLIIRALVPNEESEDSLNILEAYPCLLEPLQQNNYVNKLKALVNIEEVAVELNISQYTLTDACLTPTGPYLTLGVPGLLEKRPSLVIGDSALLKNPRISGGPIFEGCIHEVRASEILLKFDEGFHNTYCMELYDVKFKLNRTQFRRQLQSIENAESNLGWDFLFPSRMSLQTPQVLFRVKRPTSTKSGAQKSARPKEAMMTSVEDHFAQGERREETEDETHNVLKDAGLDRSTKRDKSHFGVEERFVRSQMADDFVTTDVETLKMVNTMKVKPDPNRMLPFYFHEAHAETGPKVPTLPPYTKKGQRVNSRAPALSWVNKKLNEEQKNAVMQILSGEGREVPYIIFGPPGTGKTMTLVEVILQVHLLLPDSRILVATPSNSSADLIVQRLIMSKRLKFGDVARFNSFQRSPDSIPANILPHCFNNEDDDMVLKVSRHRIIVATCSTSSSFHRLALKSGHFSHLMIDEAGYVTEPEILVPLGLVHIDSAQIVLAGDHKQLGPVLMSPLASDFGLGQSMMERLCNMPLYLPDRKKFKTVGGYDPFLVTKLVRNYRSHPDILKIPSQLFYDKDLLPCGRSKVINRFCNNEMLVAKNHPVIFHGIVGDMLQDEDSPSWYNPQEVMQTVLYCQDVLSQGVKPEDLGIISPYRKQAAKIREMLTILNVNREGIKIGSVEEFQGQEKPVILLTTTRSNVVGVDTDNKQGLGFMSSAKRFNVAITRAECLLIVIGNPNLLVKDENWRAFLEHVVYIRSYVGCPLPASMQSSSTSQIQ